MGRGGVARTQERKIAIALNETMYQGRPCKFNHDSFRWTGSGLCIECGRLKYVPTGRRKGRDKDPARFAAKEKGEIYYFSGKPCLRGHLAKRRTFNGACQECHNLTYKEKGRDYTLRTKYKITLAKYNEMLKAQNGVCLICSKKESAIDKFTRKIKTLSVDHCHDTKKVRGLLCHSCNIGIGNLRHNPEILRKAALYCEVVND